MNNKQLQISLPQETPLPIPSSDYLGFGLDVQGAAFNGSDYFTLQGTVAGNYWTVIKVYTAGAEVSSDEIKAAGHFYGNLKGYTSIKFVLSGSYSSPVSCDLLLTTRPVLAVAL